ncbi:MAG: hypothetical protein HKN91_03695 [Acidimicrobiia bacterium]|nr:hypothetical protein [Acidimicrobiia bacterium]
MTIRLRWLAMLMATMLLAASCGGDDSAEPSSDPSDTTEQTSEPGGSDDGSGDNQGDDGSNNGSGDGSGDGSDGDDAPEINPGEMPSAGEITFAVDGQTFRVTAAEVDFYTCDIDETFVNVRAESESQNWTIQIDPGSGRANASLELREQSVSYGSFTGPEAAGGTDTDAPYVLYVGRFDRTNLDDLSDFSDVGTGRVSVTCQ